MTGVQTCALPIWRETSKGENSEKIRKGPATNVSDTTLVLIPRTTNGRKQWYTKKPRRVLYKERESTVKNHSAIVNKREKIL